MLSNQRFLELAEGRLEYLWHGPGPGVAPTLVFLHEGLGCAELWRDVPEVLAARLGLGAFVYSRFGYGGSDPFPLPWPTTFMHREAEEVLPRVLDVVGIRDAILIGHSDGASIAIIHAGRYACQRIRALVLEAPHVFCEAAGNASIARLRRHFETGDLRDRLQRYHGANVDTAFNGWAGAWLDPGFREWNIEAYLPAVSVPTLMLQGRDDEYGTLAQIEAIAVKTAAETESLILDDCGHTPHRDQRAIVLDTITEFVTTKLS